MFEVPVASYQPSTCLAIFALAGFFTITVKGAPFLNIFLFSAKKFKAGAWMTVK